MSKLCIYNILILRVNVHLNQLINKEEKLLIKTLFSNWPDCSFEHDIHNFSIYNLNFIKHLEGFSI